MDAAAYLKLGKELIPLVLEAELAAPWFEIEARISDGLYGEARNYVEPHHLSQARYELAQSGLIVPRRARTRGGRAVTLWHLAGNGAGLKAFERASARKRLLATRYLGWAQGTPSRPSVTGITAEQVVHASLLQAAPHGYTLLSPDGPGVDHLLGMPSPISPFDSAVIHTRIVDGVPSGYTVMPVEVKNLRDWIYPSSQELYQLLSKAAIVQQARPDADIAPILVTRRAHITAHRMAKALGFVIIQMQRQYIAPTIAEQRVLEVRQELGLTDLVRGKEADERVVKSFVQHLGKIELRTIDLWKQAASDLGDIFEALRTAPGIGERSELLLEVKRRIRSRWGLPFNLGW